MAKTSSELGLFVPPEKERQLQELEEVQVEQTGRIRRRMMFRWMGWGAVLVLLGQWSIGFISFFAPKRLGAFGGAVTAGLVGDFKVGDVKQVREGKFYITRVPEGFFALYWKCPHLGCTVPWAPQDPAMPGPPDGGDQAFTDKGRFKCPCHGSIYNRYGQIIQGPAPRPMDRFPLTIDPTGKIVVQTGPSVAISRAVADAADAVPSPAETGQALSAMDTNLPSLIAAGFLLLVLATVLWYAARVAQPLPEAPSGAPTGALAMERKIIAIVAMIAASALLFLGYGFREPARQVAGQEAQLDTSIGRGIDTFTSLCFPCHGEKGQGAVVPDVTPLRLAPPLNRPDLRPTESDLRSKEYDFIFKTIQRGRPGTPMPTWGQIDGGALLDEHINELTLMILNGDRPVMFEGKLATPWEHTSDVVNEHVAQGLATLPKQPDVETLDFYKALNPQEQQGVKVILQRGCGGCHTIPNIPGAAGTIGPNLGPNGDIPPLSQRKTIAGGAVPNNSPDDLAKWILDPPSLKPGTAMPKLGLSPDEAAAAAAYLYSIPPAQ